MDRNTGMLKLFHLLGDFMKYETLPVPPLGEGYVFRDHAGQSITTCSAEAR